MPSRLLCFPKYCLVQILWVKANTNFTILLWGQSTQIHEVKGFRLETSSRTPELNKSSRVLLDFNVKSNLNSAGSVLSELPVLLRLYVERGARPQKNKT